MSEEHWLSWILSHQIILVEGEQCLQMDEQENRNLKGIYLVSREGRIWAMPI